jgi:HPt (histidine-containing phosphotransfer) domain-containing protein
MGVSLSSPHTELEKKIASLRASFVERLAGTTEEVNDALSTIMAATDDGDSQVVLLSLNQTAHKLAGTAGTFGFFDLGIAARRVETNCTSIIDGNEALSQNFYDDLQIFLREMSAVVKSTRR